jgi:hypothetical protein
MKVIFSIALLLHAFSSVGQKSYDDSLAVFLANYVQTHDVVKGDDLKALQFYPVNKAFRVVARFTKAVESQWLPFPTSGKQVKIFKVYGTLEFMLHGRTLSLNLYQSQNLMLNDAYKDYLFLPFTDSTSGNETYDGGRYIDLRSKDVVNGTMILDFNKAYNPSCAYGIGQYNCPIPPKENHLTIAIKAGEKMFAKPH